MQVEHFSRMNKTIPQQNTYNNDAYSIRNEKKKSKYERICFTSDSRGSIKIKQNEIYKIELFRTTLSEKKRNIKKYKVLCLYLSTECWILF